MSFAKWRRLISRYISQISEGGVYIVKASRLSTGANKGCRTLKNRMERSLSFLLLLLS